MLAPHTARRSSQIAPPPLRFRGSPHIAAVFDLEDSAERFMVSMIGWFHSDPPGLYQALALRRATVFEEHRTLRVVLEAARFQPQRRGAPPEWILITWGIDDVSVRFEKCPTRSALFKLLS